MGRRQIDCPIIIFHGENNGGNVMYISIQMSYNNLLVQTKMIVLKISNCKEKKADADDQTKEVKNGLKKDTSNYLKVEIKQYSDIIGIKNDLPNGLLQYQGLLKNTS